MERSIKSDNESSTIEDYVYKLPPPKSRPEDETDIIHRVPMNLPKDVISTLDIKTVSNVLQFVFFSAFVIKYNNTFLILIINSVFMFFKFLNF